jgi:osmotically-inducible protein OsmY
VTHNPHRSDHDIHAAVSDELQYTPIIAGHVRVAVTGGIVTLSGDVGSLPERIAVNDAAMRVSGVKAVADDLEVHLPENGAADDTTIARIAGEQLESAADVPSDTINADVRGHVITLSGHATWDYQRVAATRAVRYIRGVAAVTNTITLQQADSVSVVKNAVERAIQRNSLLDAHTIEIAVDGHELTLRGTVGSFAGRRQAEDAAWAAAGVTSVKNQLLVIQ